MRAASLVVLVTIVLPLVLSQFWAYQLGLYGLYAVAAVGVGLCWGQAGFLPLGQGLFFGLAAYLSGLAFIAFQDHLLIAVLALPLAVLVAGALAYLIGLVVFRRPDQSGAYFSMITLALCLLAFQIATSWNSVTGGFNGLKGIPGIPGLDDFSDVYYVSAAILLAVLALGGWLYMAPIGVLWRALAQNERRLQLFGFNTNQLKSVAFGVSGLMAGVGGAIYAPQQGLVTPQVVGFGLSADLVIWAAVGGRGEPARPGYRRACGWIVDGATARYCAVLGSVDGVVLYRHCFGIPKGHCRLGRTVRPLLKGANQSPGTFGTEKSGGQASGSTYPRRLSASMSVKSPFSTSSRSISSKPESFA